MSSRRLLVLLDELGKWDDAMVIAAEAHNEIARLRAAFYAVHGGEDGAYEPFAFINPMKLREQDEQDRRDAAIAAQTEPELAEAGWM